MDKSHLRRQFCITLLSFEKYGNISQFIKLSHKPPGLKYLSILSNIYAKESRGGAKMHHHTHLLECCYSCCMGEGPLWRWSPHRETLTMPMYILNICIFVACLPFSLVSLATTFRLKDPLFTNQKSTYSSEDIWTFRARVSCTSDSSLLLQHLGLSLPLSLSPPLSPHSLSHTQTHTYMHIHIQIQQHLATI